MSKRKKVALTEYSLWWKYNQELDRIETEYEVCHTDGYVDDTDDGTGIYPHEYTDYTFGGYAEPNVVTVEDTAEGDMVVLYMQTVSDTKSEKEIKQMLLDRLVEGLCKVHKALTVYLNAKGCLE